MSNDLKTVPPQGAGKPRAGARHTAPAAAPAPQATESTNGAARPAAASVEAPARPAKAAEEIKRPTTLAEAHSWLCRPFPKALIELKPGAMNGDKTRALAMPFVDMRAYYNWLDRICGPENWSSTLTATDRGVICALTIFGVTKSAAGDYPIDPRDENAATSAEAQAFKRACAAFGLGRYLYSLRQAWGKYDNQRKCFEDPAGLVAQMYAQLPPEERQAPPEKPSRAPAPEAEDLI